MRKGPPGGERSLRVLAGQYFDAESSLHYNWARYYNPRAGRDITADLISVGEHVQASLARMKVSTSSGRGVSTGFDVAAPARGGAASNLPLEINPYSYTASNPLGWTDPTGQAAAGAGCQALGIPPSVCDAGVGAGGAAGAAIGLGIGLMAHSSDLCEGEDELEKRCSTQYEEVDIPTCRGIGRTRGTAAAARCYKSAADRYGACLAGKPVPPLDTYNN